MRGRKRIMDGQHACVSVSARWAGSVNEIFLINRLKVAGLTA